MFSFIKLLQTPSLLLITIFIYVEANKIENKYDSNWYCFLEHQRRPKSNKIIIIRVTKQYLLLLTGVLMHLMLSMHLSFPVHFEDEFYIMHCLVLVPLPKFRYLFLSTKDFWVEYFLRFTIIINVSHHLNVPFLANVDIIMHGNLNTQVTYLFVCFNSFFIIFIIQIYQSETNTNVRELIKKY